MKEPTTHGKGEAPLWLKISAVAALFLFITAGVLLLFHQTGIRRAADRNNHC